MPFLVIRNATFTNCDVFDVFFTYIDGPAYGNVTLEGNQFSNMVKIRDPYGTGPINDRTARNWSIKNNLFGGGADFGPVVSSITCGNTGSVPAGWQAAC